MLAITKNQLWVPVLLSLASFGCKVESDYCTTGTRTSVENPDLRNALVARLDEVGVPYSHASTTELCYPSDRHERVVQELIQLDLAQRPANRIQVGGTKLADEVVRRLVAANIRFTAMPSESGAVIIIEDPQDRDRVRALIEATAREMFP
jgi:hypothetical protein